MTQSPPPYDEKLWFTMRSHCAGRHYLLFNPHTFPGRMGAWCPTKQVTFYVSKSEMESCSPEAHYWMMGFLAGNEPAPPRGEDGGYLADDDPQMERWRAAIRQFPETGIWVVSERFCERCGEPLLPTQPGLKCPKCAPAPS